MSPKHKSPKNALMVQLLVGLALGLGLGFIVQLAAPLSYAVYVMVLWMALGVATLFYLKAKNPRAIADVATVHI